MEVEKEQLIGPPTSYRVGDTPSEDNENQTLVQDKGLSYDEWQSEELKSDQEIEEGDVDEANNEEGYKKFSTFSMAKAMGEYKWEVGTYFSKKVEYVEAIKTYALENERSLKFFKSDERRDKVKCLGAKGKCL